MPVPDSGVKLFLFPRIVLSSERTPKSITSLDVLHLALSIHMRGMIMVLILTALLLFDYSGFYRDIACVL